jgi:hypothetical protein
MQAVPKIIWNKRLGDIMRFIFPIFNREGLMYEMQR